MHAVYHPFCTGRSHRNGSYYPEKSWGYRRPRQYTSGPPLVPSATSSKGRATTAKGLSRMKGNLHVRFLGGWRVVTPSSYPVERSGAGHATPAVPRTGATAVEASRVPGVPG